MRQLLSRVASLSYAMQLRAFCLVLTVLALSSPAMATDPPAFELAETGIDVGEAITTTITAIGAVILVALGGWFAFRLIRRALSWARTAF